VKSSPEKKLKSNIDLTEYFLGIFEIFDLTEYFLERFAS
jgi:hypothetical protein